KHRLLQGLLRDYEYSNRLIPRTRQHVSRFLRKPAPCRSEQGDLMFKAKVVDLGSPSYFVLTAAVELGFFEQEGIPIGRVEGSLTGPREMKDGALDFLGGPAYSALHAFPAFEGAQLLCALSQYSYWFMGIRADIDIKRGDIGALRGLRIA